jgi:hypothetical protein
MNVTNKRLLSLVLYSILGLFYNLVKATENNSISDILRTEQYISQLYKQLDFNQSERLSFTVFNHAMHGYLNLKIAGKLSTDKEILTICDFNQPSTINRMWVIDLASRKVLFNTYVAHGQQTGEDCAMKFSNKLNSHQSSLGFYITTEVYNGEHGTSLRMQGMDQGFNDAAFKRDIVVHGATYVSDEYICENQRLGRSWGCPAVPVKLAEPIINTIKEGTCLFIYYPDTKYLQSAYWLNRKITTIGDQQLYGDVISALPLKQKYKVVKYMRNGKVDSIKQFPLE